MNLKDWTATTPSLPLQLHRQPLIQREEEVPHWLEDVEK